MPLRRSMFCLCCIENPEPYFLEWIWKEGLIVKLGLLKLSRRMTKSCACCVGVMSFSSPSERNGGQFGNRTSTSSEEAKVSRQSTDGPLRRRSEGGGSAKDRLDAAGGRRNSDNMGSSRTSMEKINKTLEKWNKKLTRRSFLGTLRKSRSSFTTFHNREASDDDRESDDNDEGLGRVGDIIRQKEMRKGIDLAAMLERIEKNFVITDPRLPDNPIIFADVLMINLSPLKFCVGKKFYLFHLQPMCDQKGEVQYFIGVQLDTAEETQFPRIQRKKAKC